MVSLGDLQRDPAAGAPVTPAALPLRVERTRTFDTPEFAGMTFLEVESKTALNRVRGMPFGWSINPYRGCGHACSYCLHGETPILLADGRTKPIADLRRGDLLYGTERRGTDRRYVVTPVLDHWSTVRPAYRVVLEDETTLVASGDHRFLSGRGWKHVTGAEQGRAPRPHLTRNDELIGTGPFATPPKRGEGYRHGYRCGVRRDGPAIGWPADPCEEWAKGFLAGVFDAEGACSNGVLRIFDTHETITARVASCLGRFGFRSLLEPPARNGCRSIRLLGGLPERLRFLHTVDPAITRKRTLDGMVLKSDASLRVASIEPLGLQLPLFDITTGTGDFIANGVVSHNCFARPTHAYLNLSPLGDFERTVVVKTNVGEVLRRELGKPSWRGDHVAMGTNTDPYQRCEGRYRLMPGIIGALAEALTPFSVLTKGTLITRDLEHLTAAREHVPVTAALTIGMLDDALWREAEPGTPSPAARLRAVRQLNDAGIPTGVMLAPIMPGLNDDPGQLAALVDAAARAGAIHISPIVLHLRPGVREVFWPWLQAAHPELVERYTELYRRSEADATYAEAVLAHVRRSRDAAWRRHGRPPAQPEWRREAAPAASGGAQLRLL